MAKRKRLTPPQPGFLDGAAAHAPEARSWPGLEARPARPPIAQVAGDSAASAALGEIAAEFETARSEGRLAHLLPLDAIDETHLVRDRLAVEGEALDELIASLRARGQRTPVEVVDKGAGAAPRYGLISGWRRLSALRRLSAEDPAFSRIAAVVRAPEGASDAYVAMVEENEIRLGLSYYERARIVVKAVEEDVFPDSRTALRTLFGHVSRAKRSKIGSFMTVVTELDGALRFPAALGERLGLVLARRLERPATAEALRDALAATPPKSPEAELDLITAVLDSALPAAGGGDPSEDAPSDPPGDIPPSRPRKTRAPVTTDLSGDQLTLSGPGVDSDLLDALDTWLRRRGHPAG